ncbi:polysaccharide deacetylase family protein [Paenibacillus sp. L3-i20]|uniref:polysaccharide deacetylase family protein n=1 Tax=Paenibacillus sp. L3-i20 TaxID=2905833 RepID=UPI001EDDC445|nr:polysaccharide deacetylase family protein [Paenibacillus sp. L3-i20]GKU77223.1 polysaccharide deacetylase [Paenibacillus sp. L3-i20]
MHTLQSVNKIRRVKKKRRRLIFVLAAIFLLIFLIGKLTSSPEEKVVANEHIIQSDILPAKETEPVEESTGKVVYLTFDDGPTALTDQFLDALKEHDIQATFFMQGVYLQKTDLQASVNRATEEGHYVGAHSMTHDYKRLYDDGLFVSEMNDTLSLIQDITGTNPKLVRPPYGSVPGLKNQQIRDQIDDAEIKIWDWTIDSQDWIFKDNPNQIVETIKLQTKRDTEVILMHETQQTLQALPDIIAFYKQQGYEFRVYNDVDHFHLNFYNDKRL